MKARHNQYIAYVTDIMLYQALITPLGLPLTDTMLAEIQATAVAWDEGEHYDVQRMTLDEIRIGAERAVEDFKA